ncbi:MAG: hypothetical protein ACXVBY_19225, partial [Isosphaeraceae bacterium]
YIGPAAGSIFRVSGEDSFNYLFSYRINSCVRIAIAASFSTNRLKPSTIYYPGSKEGHIPTRSASEGSGAFPSLARRVNMQQHAELPCRGNRSAA